MIHKNIVSTRESGFSLLELLITLPVIVALLLSCSMAFLWGIKSYAAIMSDWELQNQVRIPMEAIVRDLAYAERVRPLGKKLYILCRATSETPQWVEYTITASEMPKITRDQQPMTGESSLGNIRILRFDYRIEKTRTVYLEIMGENLLTRHTFRLETAVTLPRGTDAT
jgi:hypothetical protein